MIGHSSSTFRKSLRFVMALVMASVCVVAAAESGGQAVNAGTKVAFRAPQNTAPAMRLTENNELVLSAAPREDDAEAETIYGPVAEYLSTVLGKKVVFKHAGNWGVYQGLMQKGAYDIVFDGPHFVSWRMARLQHVPMVKFPGNLVFVLAVKKDQARINGLKDMAGRTMCAFPPPNLATLSVQFEFDNPARQPMILESETFPQSYKKMVEGKCVGAILQKKLFEDLDKEKQLAKVLFTSKPVPNQAFSAGPKVTPEMRERIVKALLSPEGAAATQKMRDIYKAKTLAPATVEEFQGLGVLLRDVYGFGL